ncbi:MAG: PAS domain S-box protein [Anaerolineae bacterium]|nr:PAS domain S-box protein [Anaerolineae bacterium]
MDRNRRDTISRRRERLALRVALFYLLVGGMWILFSDRLLDMLSSDPDHVSRAQTYKGWFYIVVTGIGLYGVLRRHMIYQQRATGELQKSERRLRAILNAIPDLIFQTNREGQFREFDPGLNMPTVERMLGRTVADFLPSERLPQVLDDIRQTLETGHTQQSEFQHVIQGERHAFEVRYAASGQDEVVVIIRDITAVQQAQEALAREHQLLQSVIDSLPDFVYVKDTESRHLLNNIAVTRHMGLTDPADTVGKTDFDFYPPELAESFHADDRMVMQSGEPLINREEESYSPGKEPRWMLTIKVPLRDKNGVVIGLVGTGRDITARKKAEDALQFAQFGMDRASDSIMWLTDTGEITYANELTCTMLGYTHSELQRMNIYDINPSLSPEAFKDTVREVKRCGALLFETTHQTSSGELIPVEIAHNYLEFNDKTYVVTFARNITKRKQVEQALHDAHDQLERRVAERTAELAEANTRLEEERHLLRTLLDHLPDHIYVKDTDSRFIMVNDAMARSVGVATPEEVIGKTDFDFFSRELAEWFLTDERNLFETGEALINKEEPSLGYQDTPRWVLSTKVPLRDAKGDITRLVGIGRDITARKQMEDDLRAAHDELEQRVLERTAELSAANASLKTEIAERKRIEAERERLLFQAEAQATQLTTVAEVSRRASRSLDVYEVLWTASELIAENFGLYHAHIYLVDEQNNRLVLAAGSGNVGRELVRLQHSLPIQYPDSIVSHAARSREVIIVNNVMESLEFLPNPMLPDTRSEMAVPMIVGDRLIGVLDVEDNVFNRFTEDDAQIKLILAAQLAIAVQNARLYTETTHRLAIIENFDALIALTPLGDEPRRNVSYINPAGLRMSGYASLEVLLQHSISDFFPPDVLAMIRDVAVPVAMREGVWRGESVLRLRDGTLLPVEQTMLIIRDEQGAPRDLVTMMTDITERKQAEERQRQLNRQLEKRNQQLVGLQEVGRTLAATLDVGDICEVMYREVGMHLLGAPHFAIVLYDEVAQMLSCGFAIVDGEQIDPSIMPPMPLGTGPNSDTIRSRQPRIVDLTAIRSRLTEEGRMVKIGDDREPLSALYVPMVSGEKAVGVIMVQSYEADAFTEGDVNLLVALASQAAVAIENARLFAAEQEQRVLAEALRDTVIAVNRTLNVDIVLDRILDSVGRVVPHDAANIMLIEDGIAHVVRGHGYDTHGVGDWVSTQRFPVADVAVWHSMIETWLPIVIPDTAQDEAWIRISPPQEAWIRSTVKAPIVVDGEVIGILHLDSVTPGAFNQTHADRLQAFAEQAAIAIRNARLFAGEYEQRTLAEALRDTAAILNSTLEFDEVLDHILANVSTVLPSDAANIMLIDQGVAHIARARGYDKHNLEDWVTDLSFVIDETTTFSEMIKTGQPLIIPDTDEYDGWIQFKEERWLRSYASAPISLGGEVIGFLSLDSSTPGFFTPGQADRLQGFANQAANAIQNAQLFTAEREQRALAEALRDTASAVNSTLELDQVFERILVNLGSVVPCDAANLMLINDGIVRVVRGRGYDKLGIAQWLANWRFHVDEQSTLLYIMKTGKPVVVRDTQADERWVDFPETDWIRSYVCAPIRYDTDIIGFVNLDSGTPHFFTQDHADRLQSFADQAATAIRNATLYDAIERQAAELEQRVSERTAELETQRAQLQAILDAMGEALLYSAGRNVAYVNRAFNELFGFDLDEVKNDPPGIHRYILNDVPTAQRIRGRVLDAFERGQSWRGEVQLRRKDNSVFDAAITFTRVPGQHDQGHLGEVAIFRDISQEKALQAQKDRFIANASHELRTPLANVKTRLYLAHRQPEKLEWHLNVLEQVTDSMSELVESLLDVSRFERGIIPLSRKVITLQDVISGVINVQYSEAELKSVRLVSEMLPDPLRVMADRPRLEQVITNLVVNAINYTPPEGQVTVTLSHEPGSPHAPAGRAVLRVQDTGVGIDPDLLAQVFEPFFRANQGTTTGTGLGLTIAKEIVELHGGEITVESEPGHGSVFVVKLDVYDESGGGQAANEPSVDDLTVDRLLAGRRSSGKRAAGDVLSD